MIHVCFVATDFHGWCRITVVTSARLAGLLAQLALPRLEGRHFFEPT